MKRITHRELEALPAFAACYAEASPYFLTEDAKRTAARLSLRLDLLVQAARGLCGRLDEEAGE